MVGGELGEELHAPPRPALSHDPVDMDIVEWPVDTRHLELGAEGPEGLREQLKITHVGREDNHSLPGGDGILQDPLALVGNGFPDKVAWELGALQGRKEIGGGMAEYFAGQPVQLCFTGLQTQNSAEVASYDIATAGEEAGEAGEAGAGAPDGGDGEQTDHVFHQEEGPVFDPPLDFLERPLFPFSSHGSVNIW